MVVGLTWEAKKNEFLSPENIVPLIEGEIGGRG